MRRNGRLKLVILPVYEKVWYLSRPTFLNLHKKEKKYYLNKQIFFALTCPVWVYSSAVQQTRNGKILRSFNII
jgi:hypothetical protein